MKGLREIETENYHTITRQLGSNTRPQKKSINRIHLKWLETPIHLIIKRSLNPPNPGNKEFYKKEEKRLREDLTLRVIHIQPWKLLQGIQRLKKVKSGKKNERRRVWLRVNWIEVQTSKTEDEWVETKTSLKK